MTLSVFMMAGCIGAVLAAYFMRGTFGHGLIIVMVFFTCVVLMIAPTLLYSIAAKTRRIGWLRAANIAAGLLLLLALQVPGYALGKRLLRGDIHKAKSFCEQLVAPLDQYFQEHGSYPYDITAVLPANTTIPSILGDNYYNSNGDSFNLGFFDPGAMMGGYDYSSNDRRWEYWD